MAADAGEDVVAAVEGDLGVAAVVGGSACALDSATASDQNPRTQVQCQCAGRSYDRAAGSASALSRGDTLTRASTGAGIEEC